MLGNGTLNGDSDGDGDGDGHLPVDDTILSLNMMVMRELLRIPQLSNCKGEMSASETQT